MGIVHLVFAAHVVGFKKTLTNMFAVVRFIDDHDKRLHVIHVDDIDSFEPRDTSDYNNLSVYNAYWQDPVDDSNNGLYKTQVLMLAGMYQWCVKCYISDFIFVISYRERKRRPRQNAG